MSLAARLRQQYGTEVDPCIDLESVPRAEPKQAPAVEAVAAPVARPSGTSSSFTLQRLEGRVVAASRYQLRGEIARGGMGAILEVFDEDLRRRLAMKVILDRHTKAAGAESASVEPAVLSRFLEEAQVTGQLDHPGIVPVHELGLDEKGRVYFTMRLVHGRDLEDIFALVAGEQEGWSVTRALGVLQKVCEAMAYAHDKGVVHRDLKPANVMVGRFGEVYVMDWGLARVQNQADRHDIRVRTVRPAGAASPALPAGAAPAVETDRHDGPGAEGDEGLCTMDGDVVGTPSYMAPEQARGELAAIDPRTDVYALGSILYRLLAGVAPYSGAGERLSGVAVWRRVIAGPPASIDVVAPRAPAELQAICQRAMARAPTDRYPDMQALGEDLRAFLEGRVVQAFESGAFAEARKWVRRNRALAGALAAALLALVVGLFGSLVFADRAKASALVAEQRRIEAAANAGLAEQRQQQAVASEAAAKQQTRVAQQVTSFLNDDLLASIAPEHEGKDVTVRQVLDAAATRLALGFAEDSEVEAALCMTIGTSYQRLGEYETAHQHLERALELRRSDQGPRAEPTIESMRRVASVLADLGRTAEAIKSYEEALTVAREVLGADHRGTLATMNDMAIVLSAAGRNDEARTLYEAALAAESGDMGPNSENVLATRSNLALVDQAQGRFAEAEASLRDVMARRRSTLGDQHPETLKTMNSLGLVLGDLGRLEEGEELLRDVLESYQEIMAPDHPMVATATGNLGTLVQRRGRNGEAEQLFLECLRLSQLRNDDDSVAVLLAKHNLASSIDDPRRREEVLVLRQEVVAGRRRVLGPGHPETLESMNSLAVALRDAGRFDAAEALYRETLDQQRQLLGAEHPTTLITYENLGGVLFAKKDYAASEPIVREVLASRRRVLGERHPDVAKTGFNLAMVLKARGEAAGALQALDEALASTRAAYGNVHPQVAACLRTLGDLRSAAKDYTAALAAYREALEIRRQLGPDDELAGYLLHQIGFQHYALKDFEQALESTSAATTLREARSGKDAVGTRVSLRLQGMTLVALQRYAAAEPLALDALDRSQRAEGADGDEVRSCRRLLVRLYEAWNKPDEAVKWR